MYARKTSGNDCRTPKQPWRQGCMFATAAFAVVLVADDDPFDAMGFVETSYLGKRLVVFARDQVASLTGHPGECVDKPHEHIVAELVEMAAIAQPWTSGG